MLFLVSQRSWVRTSIRSDFFFQDLVYFWDDQSYLHNTVHLVLAHNVVFWIASSRVSGPPTVRLSFFWSEEKKCLFRLCIPSFLCTLVYCGLEIGISEQTNLTCHLFLRCWNFYFFFIYPLCNYWRVNRFCTSFGIAITALPNTPNFVVVFYP